MPLNVEDLENVSGGFESDEIYERYDGFLATKKELVNNTAPFPCPSCQVTTGGIITGTKDGKPAWICQQCGKMFFY